jgi:hypothetical protein
MLLKSSWELPQIAVRDNARTTAHAHTNAREEERRDLDAKGGETQRR